MWYDTPITKLSGAKYPILQGPFGGGYSTVKLTALVSNMGGIGGFGAYTLAPQEIAETIKSLKAATDKPFNINLWVSNTDTPEEGISDTAYEKAKALLQTFYEELSIPFPEKPGTGPASWRFEDQLQVILDTRPPIFSFVFGIPNADVLEECRKRGILTAGAATSLDEAMSLEAAGVDMIIASGSEAGGHRPSFLAPAEESLTSTSVLMQQISERTRTPLIAAGGIANGKAVVSALALGAHAAQIGTAFLACEESGAPAFHRDLLFTDAAKYTTLTRAFTGRLGRGLANRITRDLAGQTRDILPFPLQGLLLRPLRQAAISRGQWDLISMWTGQIATQIQHTRAADLMTALIAETNSYFNPTA